MSNTATVQTVEQKQAKRLADVKKNLAKYTFGANAPVVKEGHARAEDPRVDLDSVQWEQDAGKNSVEIISIYSLERRRVYTSDVFQIFGTEQETKDAKKAKREALKAEEKAGLALLKANKESQS